MGFNNDDGWSGRSDIISRNKGWEEWIMGIIRSINNDVIRKRNWKWIKIKDDKGDNGEGYGKDDENGLGRRKKKKGRKGIRRNKRIKIGNRWIRRIINKKGIRKIDKNERRKGNGDVGINDIISEMNNNKMGSI